MTQSFLQNYFSILCMIGVSSFIAIIMIVLPFITKKRNNYANKSSPYECGFEPLSRPRENRFNIKFYIIAALFIIFDLEIVFMVPWALTLKSASLLSFFSMSAFILLICLGLLYEWGKGALDN